MRHKLVYLSIILLSSRLIGQSEKAQNIFSLTRNLVDIAEVSKKMPGKTLDSKLDSYFF